jgi:hypothetical protein
MKRQARTSAYAPLRSTVRRRMPHFQKWVVSVALYMGAFSTAAGCPSAPVHLPEDALCFARLYISNSSHAEMPMKYRVVDRKEYWLVYHDPVDKNAKEGWGRLRVYKTTGEIAVVGLHPFVTPNKSLERTRER